MRWDRLTPTEIAGLDAALMDGIAGALTRSSGLLVMKTGATGDGGWICAFPPYGLSFVAAKEWARRHQLTYSLDDLYLTFNEVVRAGADMQAAASGTEPSPQEGAIAEPREIPPERVAASRPASMARPADSRGSRAWLRAFHNGFNKTTCPVETDGDAFIELLEIADRRLLGGYA